MAEFINIDFDINTEFKTDFSIGSFDFEAESQKPIREKVKKSAQVSEKVIEDRKLKRFIKNEEIHHLVAKKLNDLCARPKPNEQYRIVTEKAFNAYAFILSVLEEGDIEELFIAIYRINEPTVQSLINLITEGKIKKATFIISSFFNQTKRPERWAQMLAQFCKDNPDKTNFAYLHNHSKVVCIKQGGGNYYVFEGSGNMSDNARIEQYTYENNKDVYDFHTTWMTDLINQMKDKQK